MTLPIGSIAPDFAQATSDGQIRFYDWLDGHWCVLFSHPRDFTPVCTTELGEAARLMPEFERRGVKVLGLSVDEPGDHARWADDISRTQGHAPNFPIIADADRKVATLYGMIHPAADPLLTVRTVYLIDPAKKVRLTLTYPPATGRNFAEIIRVIDSLQLTDRHGVATPVNWQPGEPVIILPSVTDAQAAALFPQGWSAQTSYLRVVAAPVGTQEA